MTLLYEWLTLFNKLVWDSDIKRVMNVGEWGLKTAAYQNNDNIIVRKETEHYGKYQNVHKCMVFRPWKPLELEVRCQSLNSPPPIRPRYPLFVVSRG